MAVCLVHCVPGQAQKKRPLLVECVKEPEALPGCPGEWQRSQDRTQEICGTLGKFASANRDESISQV